MRKSLRHGSNNAFSPEAGIAIGPILFVIAMLAVLAIALSSGNGEFGSASVIDRIGADIQSQASLIRTKINECNVKWGTNGNYDGYPSSLDGSNNATPTAVSALECSGDPSGVQALWTGARPLQLPPPTNGFTVWNYINTDTPNSTTPCTFNGEACLGGVPTGGRCIWIAPQHPDPSNTAIVAGLSKAANKFTHATSNDGTAEVNYDPASASQKFILWISIPAVGQEDSDCKP